MITHSTQPIESQAELLNSLSVEALRQGQTIWFRVVSGSMRPLMLVGDAILIEPATPHDLHTGDIAAFQTQDGLVVHRITHIFSASTRFIEMGDVALKANEITGESITGRVKAIRRGSRLIDLRRPIAQRVGRVTARLRYQFYCWYEDSRFSTMCLVYRKTARLLARIGSTTIRLTCASTDHTPLPFTTKAR